MEYGAQPRRQRQQTRPLRITSGAAVALLLTMMMGWLLAGRVAAQENEAIKPGAALRAAQDRLLDRLWQMPFYLVAAKPPSPPALSSSSRPGAVSPETQAPVRSGYGPWRENIVATVFWVGEAAGPHNPVPNDASAWDREWLKTFGGIDDPRNRTGVFPARFLPKRNPFYVALPFNDLLSLTNRPPLAHLIPWAAQGPPYPGSESLCHGAWIAVRNAAGKVCYAQWEDVGPFEVNHWQYVFGGDRPRANRNGGAGIDLSPAVRDYLHLHGLDVVDWRFLSKEDVPPGPWLYYGRNGDKLDARLVVNALRTLVTGNW
jgi:hypothetical protein